MRKNLLLLSALVLPGLVLSVNLSGSLAQGKASASAPELHGTMVFGPVRKPQSRRKTLVSSLSSIPASSSSSSTSSVQVDWQPPKILDIVPMDESSSSSSTYLDDLLNGTTMEEKHRRMSHDVLSLLDPSCQEKLQSFTVLYNNPKQRGLAGFGVVIVSGNVPDTEFIGLLLHEALGHFRDITCVTGTTKSGASAFRDGATPVWNDDPSARFYAISWTSEHVRKADAAKEDFVTGYAYAGDSFEDMAESVAYYIAQEKSFRARAETNDALAAKLAWLETYMPKNGDLATGQDWNGQIAWDATKLPFEWIGVQ